MLHFSPHGFGKCSIIDPCQSHGAVHALRLGNIAQDFGVAHIAAVMKIGSEQSHFQPSLCAPSALATKDGQQFVRVERVIDAHAFAIIERKTDAIPNVG